MPTPAPAKGIAVVAAFFLATLPPLRAETASTRTDEIAQAEEEYSQSFVTGDVSVARRVVSDDFVGTEPDGKISDKGGVLADVRAQPRPLTLKITALIVRFHGDTAIALGTEEDTNAGTPKLSHRRWLDTWKKTPAGWRLVASAEMIPRP